MLGTQQAIPAVWVYTTSGAFNALRAGGYGAFLSADQQARVERIRQARLLFDGQHKRYFLEEERTQFEFAPVRAGSRMLQMYLTYNVLGLISLKGADLLFGEEPLLSADDEYQQAALAGLVERCELHALAYGCAVDASYEGECFLEACVAGGEVYLRQVPADTIFPVGDRRADGQYGRYDRFELANVGTETAKLWVLLETRYLVGRIERNLWQLDDGGHKTRRLTLDQWPTPEGVKLADVEPTGIDRNTITWVPNLLVRGKPVSDYDGAIDLQDTLNAKTSQVGRVLLKHADPKLALPEEAFNDNGTVDANQDAFPYREPDRIPKYVTWNAELANAMADRAFVLNQLLVRTETSPVLLGLKEGAAPDAYKKVRLESFNSLTKAARKATYWRAGIRRAVTVAQDLEQTLPGVRFDRGPIGVKLRDGIPQDSKEQAEELAILRGASLLSREGALEQLYGDPAAVAKEYGRLQDEQRQAVPSTLLGEPGQAPGLDAGGPAEGDASATATGEQTEAVAGNDLRSTVGALNAIQSLQIAYYSRQLPRDAAIANATALLGFSPEEAAGLFPDVAPDAPKAPGSPTPTASPFGGKGAFR